MAQLHQSAATLRIGGDSLDPAKISEMLGASPTRSQTKGDKIVGKKTGTVRIAKSGMWLLVASERQPEDVNGQIEELFSKTTSDLSLWREIAQRYEIDLFCGWFMKDSNEGLCISAKSIQALADRGVELAVDIYANIEHREVE